MASFPNPPFYTDPLVKSGRGDERVFHPQWQDWFIKVAQYITATGGYGGGILPATSGGTGFGTYAIGDLLYASTTSALNRLADVATGNALISGGVGVAPSWGKIALTTHVSGNLPGANGPPWITFTSQASGPAANALYTDNGTNYTVNTLIWNNPAVFLGEVGFGDSGTEQGSITVNGSTFDAIVKINEFGGTRDAHLILHRHSDTAATTAGFGFARARGNTSSHSDVQSGDVLGEISFVGWNTSSYYRAVRVLVEVANTPGVTDMPGKIRLMTSPDGSATPADKLVISSTGVNVSNAPFYPPTDAAATQSACALYAGTGAPNNANGANGDYYFRSDGGALTHIYFKAAGAWAGII